MEVRSLSQKAALDWTKKFQALQKNISFYMEQEEDLASFVSSLFKMQNFELHLIVGSGVRNGTKEQNGPLEARLFEDHQVPGMSWFLKKCKATLACTLAVCNFLQLFSTTPEELRHFQKSPTVKPFLQGSLEKKNNKICFFFKKSIAFVCTCRPIYGMASKRSKLFFAWTQSSSEARVVMSSLESTVVDCPADVRGGYLDMDNVVVVHGMEETGHQETKDILFGDFVTR